MKHLLRFLLLTMLVPFFSACGGSDAPDCLNYHRGHERRHSVRLSLGGDFIEQSDLPLTRADGDGEPTTYVGIYVRTRKLDTDRWQYYAYGVFDDQSKMQLDMTEGYYYEFYATTLSASTDVFVIETSGKEHQMDRPFKCNNENGVQDAAFNADNMNKFIYSDIAYFLYLNKGTANVRIPGINTPQKYRYPRVNRYYGKLNAVKFTSQTQGIEIPVERKNFGICIKTIGLPEGTSLSWIHGNPATSSTSEGSSELQFTSRNLAGSNVEEQSWSDIYSLYNLDTETTAEFRLDFTWQRTSSVKETYSVTFTPTANVIKVLKFDFTKQAAASGVNITIKPVNTEMRSEEQEIIWN